MADAKALLIRQAALQANLPAADPAVQALIEQSKIELTFIERFKHTNGWSEFHPEFVMQIMSCLRALENKTSLSKARGDGRLATILNVTKSNGSGLGRSMGSIERFNGLLPAEREVGPGNVTYPVIDLLPYSSKVLNKLKKRISARQRAKPHRSCYSDQERASLLLDSTMTDHAVVANTIEYLARAFAHQVDPEVRHELIRGDGRLSLKSAFDTLQFAPA